MAKAPSSAARNAGQAGLKAVRKAGGEAARLNGVTNIKKNGKAPDVIDSSADAAKKAEPPKKSVLDDHPNAKPISAKDLEEKLGRHNAGTNAPKFKDWEESGGWLKHDPDTGAVIYGKNMNTSTKGNMDVEIPYVNGKPIFDDFTDYTTQIRPFQGDRVDDYYEANKKLMNEKRQKAEEIGVVKKKKNEAKRSRPQAKGDTGRQKYVWHHHEDGTSMLLVDFEVHDLFDHAGGHSGK
ncbi:HNH endonuclease [Pseudovibrio sp. Alg231-02]|uniref:HNH endonuclease n=1 Tax=Pseudovibrio sp. Alg231-02 TaxID=1922223 RepID=UPI000D559C18|nr:HNH endonuclease [Pseudovibrio sp. Alg231-02]